MNLLFKFSNLKFKTFFLVVTFDFQDLSSLDQGSNLGPLQ